MKATVQIKTIIKQMILNDETRMLINQLKCSATVACTESWLEGLVPANIDKNCARFFFHPL